MSLPSSPALFNPSPYLPLRLSQPSPLRSNHPHALHSSDWPSDIFDTATPAESFADRPPPPKHLRLPSLAFLRLPPCPSANIDIIRGSHDKEINDHLSPFVAFDALLPQAARCTISTPIYCFTSQQESLSQSVTLERRLLSLLNHHRHHNHNHNQPPPPQPQLSPPSFPSSLLLPVIISALE